MLENSQFLRHSIKNYFLFTLKFFSPFLEVIGEHREEDSRILLGVFNVILCCAGNRVLSHGSNALPLSFSLHVSLALGFFYVN